MSKDEALSLALTTLENVPIEYDFHGNPIDAEFGEQLETTLQALRKALEDTSVAEPVAWKYMINGSHMEFSETKPPSDAYDDGSLTPLYASPPVTNPEPVAWIGHNRDGHVELADTKPTESVRQDFNMRPLYEVPPKREWVGLTAEDYRGMSKELANFAYAVEDKLRRKNS